MVVFDHGSMKPADLGALNGVKYVAFYYSAKWCPPCRAFSPRLVDFYAYFKKSHPNFEIIFVDDDPDEDGMLEYMKMDQMAWVGSEARRHRIAARLHAKQVLCGPGIPCLVLVDDTGKVLADSYVNGEYVGPESVVGPDQEDRSRACFRDGLALAVVTQIDQIEAPARIIEVLHHGGYRGPNSPTAMSASPGLWRKSTHVLRGGGQHAPQLSSRRSFPRPDPWGWF